MNSHLLLETARRLVDTKKGLLAIDESTTTCDKRFAALGIAQDYEMRAAYREVLITTPLLNACISGAILYDETIRQSDKNSTPVPTILTKAGILTGIKVDTGAKDLAFHPGETVTEGLDGLRPRLQEYFHMGARFAKWRAVFTISDSAPTESCILANAHALARYAALCQEAGILPVVEPEVLMAGTHTIERCATVTERVLHTVFSELYTQGVMLEGIILKPNMVVPGSDCAMQQSVTEVADMTIRSFLRVVPAAVAGIAFLSGGQGSTLASARLNAMHTGLTHGTSSRPWPLTFSFGRALQCPALPIWDGKAANRIAAQSALLHRARCNKAAIEGTYGEAMENQNIPTGS